MKSRQKRIVFVLLAVIAVGAAAALITVALRSNLNYFYTPSQIAAGEAPVGQLMRIGGMVEKGSLNRKDGELGMEFSVTDMKSKLIVRYEGILPDLFKEGQGTVAKGRLQENGVFLAEEVLAKHDEKYIPPEIADTMKAMQDAKNLKELSK
jgi:cytochrome c-type biogenesis protein CcmE